jgi:hypothetical protein
MRPVPFSVPHERRPNLSVTTSPASPATATVCNTGSVVLHAVALGTRTFLMVIVPLIAVEAIGTAAAPSKASVSLYGLENVGLESTMVISTFVGAPDDGCDASTPEG